MNTNTLLIRYFVNESGASEHLKKAKKQKEYLVSFGNRKFVGYDCVDLFSINVRLLVNMDIKNYICIIILTTGSCGQFILPSLEIQFTKYFLYQAL